MSTSGVFHPSLYNNRSLVVYMFFFFYYQVFDDFLVLKPYKNINNLVEVASLN